MKRVMGSGFVLLSLAVVSLGAGRSEVADAVMRGDRAAVQKLVEQHAEVNAAQADHGQRQQYETTSHDAFHRCPLQILQTTRAVADRVLVNVELIQHGQ